MKKILQSVLYVLISAVCISAQAQDTLPITQSAIGAKVYIISPQNNEVVSKTFTVKFGLSGMGVAPAGVDKPNTGHHHLLIDADSLPPKNLPMSGDVMHFGGGQTEVELTLSEGKHTLRLVLGDKFHIPHNPMVVSEEITITVK